MPTGDAPTTSELSTILLPNKVRLILEVLRYLYFHFISFLSIDRTLLVLAPLQNIWAFLIWELVKIASFNVWIRYFTWNFKATLRNSTQNILPIHWKVYSLLRSEILRAHKFTGSKAFINHFQTYLSYMLILMTAVTLLCQHWSYRSCTNPCVAQKSELISCVSIGVTGLALTHV